MLEDGLSSAKPLSSDEDTINSLSDINDKFTSISYSKGGSIIRMLEHIVGPDKFKKMLQAYLQNKYVKIKECFANTPNIINVFL